MTKPPTFAETMFGAMGLPGFGAPPAGLDPLKGFAIPTVDVEEIDRRITDLRSVEGWLQTQATMVRTTIQALEVQRNTVVMVKSFGNSMPGAASFFNPGAAAPPAPVPAPAAAPAPAPPLEVAPAADPLKAAVGDASMAGATVWWGMLQDQFSKMAGVAVETAKGRGATDKPSSGPGAAKRSSTARSASKTAGKTAARKKPAAKRKSTRPPG